MNKIILAQATTEVPWKYLPPWIFGFIAFLSVVLLALMVIYYFRKIFGRKPPISEELSAMEKKLRSEVYHAKGSIRQELLGRIVSLEEKYEQMQLDRERKWAELQKDYHGLELTMARMAGAFDQMKNILETKL